MEPLFNITEAIGSLYPTCKWTLKNDDYETLWWDDQNDFPPPELSELEAEKERLKNEWENKEYQRLRSNEYPSVEDQLDLLYHNGYDGWKNEINRIKEKYPKS